MAIIDREAGRHNWDERAWSVVRRMVHTSADFDYVKNVRLHPAALDSALNALASGATIVTDTNMARVGISTARLEPLGGRAVCLIDDPRTAARAREQGVTRSLAAVDLAVEGGLADIFVIGNAPTALFRLIEHIRARRVSPALVVGVPVGFVNAAESKAALAELDTPFITSLGRKGGSNVAAGVINALVLLCGEDGKNERG